MYYVALNVLHNMNSSRVKLYRAMKECFGNNREISEKKILELGRKLELPDHLTKYEYDGCLYADFVMVQNKVKRLSEKAKVDFDLYDSETKYKLLEIPLTIDLSPRFLELKMNRVDTIDKSCEEKLLSKGWSRNKSLQRYKKRVYSYDEFRSVIYELLDIFGDRKEYRGSTEDLLKTYGNKRRNIGDWHAWINFRGCYQSGTLFKYKQIYSDIFEDTDKAIEWGGKEITVRDLEEICRKTENCAEKFIEDSMEDGMLRRTGTDRYALTGHAAAIHKCCKDEFHLKRLSIIIRKGEKKRFALLIGENSLYMPKIQNTITCDTREAENHWLLYETDELENMLSKLVNIVASFEIYEEYFYSNWLYL